MTLPRMTLDSWPLTSRATRRVTVFEARGDAAVIERSRSSPEEFGAIYDAYVVEIHNYVERRLGRDTADDLAAETFLVAFRQRGRYDLSRDNARPWLYGIATNLMKRHRRQETAYYRALLRSAQAPTADPHEDRVASRVSAQHLRPELMQALAGLSAGDRDVVLLAAFADLGRDEIAQALGIPAGTVGSRLHRARRKLRAALPASALDADSVSTPKIEDEVSDHE